MSCPTSCQFSLIIRYLYCRTANARAYLLLFLQRLLAAADHDHSRIAARVLNMHTLGEHVAPHWRLQEVRRWVPPRAGDPLEVIRIVRGMAEIKETVIPRRNQWLLVAINDPCSPNHRGVALIQVA